MRGLDLNDKENESEIPISNPNPKSATSATEKEKQKGGESLFFSFFLSLPTQTLFFFYPKTAKEKIREKRENNRFNPPRTDLHLY